MAWRQSGDKHLSEPAMVSLLTHICVTWPQWVNPKLIKTHSRSRIWSLTHSHCRFTSLVHSTVSWFGLAFFRKIRACSLSAQSHYMIRCWSIDSIDVFYHNMPLNLYIWPPTHPPPPSVVYMRQWTGSALVQAMGLSPVQRQASTRTNAHICQFETSFCEILIKTFHSHKCIWKYRLRNGGHFVQREVG